VNIKRIPAFKALAPILIVTEDKKSARDYLLSRIKDLGLTHIQVRVVPSTGSRPDKVSCKRRTNIYFAPLIFIKDALIFVLRN
jgi:hypothetical protein